MILLNDFTDSTIFLKACERAFNEIDEDKNGVINDSELFIGILLLFK